MTRVQILEDKKALLLAQREVLENKLYDIGKREQVVLTGVLVPYFNNLKEEVVIDIKRGGVYFTMPHPDYSYNKELFNIYLDEGWSEKEKAYKGLKLSYYTTQTGGMDSWELMRLRMLGEVAEIILYSQKEILEKINEVADSFLNEKTEVYSQMTELRREINTFESQIRELKREKIREDLMGEGVRFRKDAYLQLKFNYTVRIKSIKLVDVSKSGKRATAVITFAFNESSVSREENVDVAKIADQVLARIDDIVSTSELV
jgi:hypothetical protein